MTTESLDDDALGEVRETCRLREAFLAASAKILPGVAWRELPSGGLKYPYSSPAPSSLAVSFEDAEFTVYFGPEILWHAHFTPIDGYREIDTAATEALAFIKKCVRESPRLWEAFLDMSAKILPGVEWRESHSGLWEYPHSSSVLGSLSVAFVHGEIAAIFGPQHLYCHRDFRTHDDTREEYVRAATKALAFINELVSDRIVVRWGSWARHFQTNYTYSERWLKSPLGRSWRLLTPQAHEATWSGKKLT